MSTEEPAGQLEEEAVSEQNAGLDFSSEGDEEGRVPVFDEEEVEEVVGEEQAPEGGEEASLEAEEQLVEGGEEEQVVAEEGEEQQYIEEEEGGEVLEEDDAFGEEEFEEQACAEREMQRGAMFEEALNTGELAEIVLITTSLGSIKRQFFASKRLQHFLDCKAVVYLSIDCNRDLSTAMNLKDVELFREWRSLGILKTTQSPEKDFSDQEGEACEIKCAVRMVSDDTLIPLRKFHCAAVLLPQVLVDGVAVGGESELQDLEEDGDLDWIFARAACPSCLHEKSPDASSCPSCGVVFSSLVPPELVAEGCVQQMLQGYAYNSTEAEDSRELKERWASGLQQADFEFESDKREDNS